MVVSLRYLRVFLSLRSGVSIKPGAASPRDVEQIRFQPVITGDSPSVHSASACFAGLVLLESDYLGLTPQALRLRLLRRLSKKVSYANPIA